MYGQGEAYLLPRGSFQRSPVTKEVDIKLMYGRRLGKNNTIWAFMDVFNLFNAQQELDEDQNYTFDGSVPIVGGDTNDLKHLKINNGGPGGEQSQTVHVNSNFGQLNAHQAPQSIRFGVRLQF